MFQQILLQLRRTRGLSQQRLASLAGLDHSLVCRYEKGERRPTRETLIALARALQTTPEETKLLFHAAGYLTPEEQMEITAQYEASSNEEAIGAVAS